MKQIFKRAVAVFLTIVMLFTMASTAVFASETNVITDYPTLVLNQEQVVTIPDGEEAIFSFTPTESGAYTLGSFADSNIDPYLTLYDSNMGYLMSDDDTGIDLNFYLEAQFTAGTTYYFGITTYSRRAASFSVMLKQIESPIANIDFHPITLTEKISGSWTEDLDENGEFVEYFKYEWWDYLTYTVTMKNGDVVDGSGTSFEYDYEYYDLHYQDSQNYQNVWTAGNTYSIEVSVDNISSTVEVYIDSFPSIVLNEETIVHISDEYMKKYFSFTPTESGCYNFKSLADDEDTYGYLYDSDMNIIVSNDDDGVDYNFSIKYPLTAGETYYLGVRYYSDKTGSFPVKLSKYESPIESIVFDPVSIYKETNGYWSDWEDEFGVYHDYYVYEWWENVTYTVTMKNGDVVEGSGSDFYYDDELIQFDISNTQSYHNKWTAGNSYTGELSLFGVTYSVDIQINESPIQSIEINPVTLNENIDGYWSDYWDDEIEEYVEYFKYDWWNRITYTVTMKNGDVVEGYGTSFEYKNTWFELDYYNDQSYYKQWSAGETYFGTVYMSDIPETTVEISIAGLPTINLNQETIVNISETNKEKYYSFTPSESGWYLFESFCGDDTYGYILDSYGEAIESNDDGGEGKNFYLRVFLNADETYYFVAKFLDDITGSFPVKLSKYESPIANIVLNPIILSENTDGIWHEYWDDETEEYVEYFQYSWLNKLSYTITMKNGDIVEGSGRWFYYNGKEYRVNTTDNQSYENRWLLGNTYFPSIEILGFESTVDVTILAKNVINGIEYLIQDDSAYIIGVEGSGDVLTIPENIAGYPVKAILSLEGADYTEIVIPDSVTSVSQELLYDCYGLKKITIGAGVEYLHNNMFKYLDSLEEIVVSSNNPIYATVDGIVYDKPLTKMVAIPNAKTTLHNVPASATNINLYINGSYKFLIDLSNSNSGYLKENGILYNSDKTVVYSCDPDKTGSYVMPDSVTSISNAAFERTNLTEITVSNNVSEIVYYAFAESQNLQKVVLPDSLQTISEYAFAYCTNLQSAVIPDNVKTISHNAFSNCEKLTEVNIPNSLEYLGAEAFYRAGIKTAVIPAGVKNIAGSAFASSALEKLTLAEGVISVGPLAFASTNIKELKLPNSLQTVDYMAFYNSPLEEVDFGLGVMYIDTKAFAKTNLKSISLPDTVTDITYKCFMDSASLLDIDLPDNLNTLDGYAFHGTEWYEKQDDGVVYIENAVYHYKGDMPEDTHIDIKSGTNIIADFAFGDMENLKSIRIPASVTTIGYRAFNNADNLKDVYYYGTEDQCEEMIIYSYNEPFENADWHYISCNHDWDSATCAQPKTCKLCGMIEGNILEHVYDNACDANCNLCSAVREVPDHIYDNACDTTCNVCNQNRTVSEHVYDNSCDNACNVCGMTRTIVHNYEWVIDQENNCGINGLKHEECTVCGEKRSANTIIQATGNHNYDNACDTTCNVCGCIREITHEYFAQYLVNDNCHWRECVICGFVVDKAEHIYDNLCDKTCNVCGIVREVGDHIYTHEADKYCDICDAERGVIGQHLIEEDDKIYYYLDGEKQNITDLVKINGVWYYISNGVWDTSIDTLHKINGKWFLIKGGIWKAITGLEEYKGKTFYVVGGKWNADVTDLKNVDGKWYYIQYGKWNNTIDTLHKINGKWFLIKKGMWNKTTGLVDYQGKTFLVKGGKWDSSVNTLYKKGTKLYAIKSGKVYTGKTVISYNGKKYYCNKGYAQTSYSGKVKIGSKTYTVKKGIVK